MRARRLIALALAGFCGTLTYADAQETKIRIGNVDAVLTMPADADRPPVALLIAGSGSTDHDGNGPQAKPATLKKLSEQLAARKIATLRYDKRGAPGWKPEFGKPEDFRFKDFVDDAVALVNYLRSSGKFSRLVVIGHSEGGLVAILTAGKVPLDRLVLLVTAARRQIVDPPPKGLAIAPSMQPSLASAFVEDPIDPLKSIDRPTLIVGGGHDLQVARLDFAALSAASPLAKTLWLPEMNHVLVDVGDDADNFAAYNQPERPLDATLIDTIAAFVLASDTR
jgi:uncharacterized protein